MDRDVSCMFSRTWDYELKNACRHLFANSRQCEAEEICLSGADHRLYFSAGYTLIQVLKSLATFEPEDLEAAMHCCADSLIITQLLRKKEGSMLLRFARGAPTVAHIKSMSVVQRHAELVFAECTLMKVRSPSEYSCCCV